VKPRERVLSRLALGDDVVDLPADDLDDLDMGAVEPRNEALVRLGALLAIDPSPNSLHRVAQDAEIAGVSPDEIVRCLVSLVPTLGIGRTSAVASNLALAIGFDINSALEELNPGR